MIGIPVRLVIGARDLAVGKVEVARRDTKEKLTVDIEGVVDYIKNLLDDIQDNLFNRAKAFRDERITRVDTLAEFEKVLEEKGGFISAHWDGTTETEKAIKEQTKATIRCIPLDNPQEDGVCIFTGKPSKERVFFAKAY
jgi:prolyl-tRNA synthetase